MYRRIHNIIIKLEKRIENYTLNRRNDLNYHQLQKSLQIQKEKRDSILEESAKNNEEHLILAMYYKKK